MVLSTILFTLGLTYITQLFLDLLYTIYSFTRQNEHLPTAPSWALITGSTDGIGLGFAEELAKKGYNIIQLSRNASKMSAVSTHLTSSYGIQTINLPFSFSKAAQDPIFHYTSLISQLSHLPISIIINNVGVATSGFSSNLPEILELLAVNIWPSVLITKLLLEKGKTDKKTVKIVNLSSTGAVPGLGLSFLSVYAASKAFLLAFSEVLNSEEGNVLALTPGWVDTPMTRPFKDQRILVITKNECASKALAQLGSVPSTYGHPKHFIAAWHYRLTNTRKALLRLV